MSDKWINVNAKSQICPSSNLMSFLHNPYFIFDQRLQRRLSALQSILRDWNPKELYFPYALGAIFLQRMHSDAGSPVICRDTQKAVRAWSGSSRYSSYFRSVCQPSDVFFRPLSSYLPHIYKAFWDFHYVLWHNPVDRWTDKAL